MTLKNDKYAYRVIWSENDQAYLGLCAGFPSLSWLAETPEGALKGIRLFFLELRDQDRWQPSHDAELG